MNTDSLLREGYFPKELPPLFHTAGFADFVEEQGPVELTPPPGMKHLVSRPAVHNLARPGRLRRKLQVANPLNQLELTDLLVTGWDEIAAHLDRSELTKSRPVSDTVGSRALVTELSGNDLPLVRAEARATGSFVLNTDISRYYHSIYTHSIPWALRGRAWAKRNRTGGLGNELDRVVRNAQDGQTLGIPVGPDTSLVLAEVIATAVDVKVQDSLRPGFRFMDDYEFVFPNRSAAERGLLRVEEALSEFELAVNPLKTLIEPLPRPLDKDWISAIRQYELDEDVSPDEKDLLRYFDHVFGLVQRYSGEPILAYAVGRLRALEVDEDNWPTYQNLLLQCAVAEPAALSTVVGQMFRHASYGISERVDAGLSHIIRTHAPLGHASEVVWALWSAIWFERPLSADAEGAAAALDDPFVSLLVLLAYERGVFSGAPDPDQWRDRVAVSELYDRNWLLAYEVRRQGWLSMIANRGDFEVGSTWEAMSAQDVTFINPQPETPVRYLVDVSGYGEMMDVDRERDTSPAF